MQGTWNHGRAHYRCRYPYEYAAANGLEHPLSIYVREDAVLPALDSWLATAFAPDRVEASLTALHDAQPTIEPEDQGLREILADCDRRLSRHRAALEAGADPSIVTGWISQVQAERTAALAAVERTSASRRPPRRLTRQEIKDLAKDLGRVLDILRSADADDKAQVYRHLGLKLSYDHDRSVVVAETAPRSSVDVLVVSEGVSWLRT